MYARLLGDSIAGLPAPLVSFYCGKDYTCAAGTFTVRRGATVLARVLASMFRLPAAGNTVLVRLAIRRDSNGESWVRTFDDRRLVSRQWQRGSCLCERFGPAEFHFRLTVEGQGIRFQQERVTLWSLPLPRLLAPGVEAFTWWDEAAQAVRVQAQLALPVAGLLLGYDGRLNDDRVVASSAAGRDRSV